MHLRQPMHVEVVANLVVEKFELPFCVGLPDERPSEWSMRSADVVDLAFAAQPRLQLRTSNSAKYDALHKSCGNGNVGADVLFTVNASLTR
jgi:hypothetical protein